VEDGRFPAVVGNGRYLFNALAWFIMTEEQRKQLNELVRQGRENNELLQTLIKTVVAGLGKDVDEIKKKSLVTLL